MAGRSYQIPKICLVILPLALALMYDALIDNKHQSGQLSWTDQWPVTGQPIFASTQLIKTRLPLDEMTAILQTTFSNVFWWMKIFSIQISLKLVPKSTIDNGPALV